MMRLPAFNQLTLFSMLLCLMACGSDRSNDKSQLRNIFGADERLPVADQEAPYRSIGRMDVGCSGTLIGKRLVLTAAHCIVPFLASNKDSYKELGWFRPFFKGNLESERSQFKRVWYGSDEPEENRSKDWAILELEKPLGIQNGWLDIENVDFSTRLPIQVSLAGYAMDFANGNLMSQINSCFLLRTDPKERILNNCDSAVGISGAPFFIKPDSKTKTYSIVAMAVSELRGGASNSLRLVDYQDELANLAIGSNQFYEVAKRLRSTVDEGLAPPTIPGVRFKEITKTSPQIPGQQQPGGGIGQQPTDEIDQKPIATNPGQGNITSCMYGYCIKNKESLLLEGTSVHQNLMELNKAIYRLYFFFEQLRYTQGFSQSVDVIRTINQSKDAIRLFMNTNQDDAYMNFFTRFIELDHQLDRLIKSSVSFNQSQVRSAVDQVTKLKSKLESQIILNRTT